MRPLLNVIQTPLVAIDCKEMGMRRYVGRECTHAVELQGTENCTGREVLDLIELFRSAPLRALGREVPAMDFTDQPVPA